jgi:hypothetical protein
MCILHAQDFYSGYQGPVQPAILVPRNRIMVRNEYQAIGMIQVHGKLSSPSPLCQFMASARTTFGRPKIHKACGGPEFSHANPDFSSPSCPVRLFKLRSFIEGFFQLFILKGYIQTASPSIKINLLG